MKVGGLQTFLKIVCFSVELASGPETESATRSQLLKHRFLVSIVSTTLGRKKTFFYFYFFLPCWAGTL